MNLTGTIQGIRTYSFQPEGSSKRYEGFSLCILRDKYPGDTETRGQFSDTLSISFRDIGSYAPEIGDPVRYDLHKENGKPRCGYVIPL